jgi:hypothetical protein
MKRVAWAIYITGNLATFGKLTFLDGYGYNWWSWPIVIPINEFLAAIWPLYWGILRWLPALH